MFTIPIGISCHNFFFSLNAKIEINLSSSSPSAFPIIVSKFMGFNKCYKLNLPFFLVTFFLKETLDDENEEKERNPHHSFDVTLIESVDFFFLESQNYAENVYVATKAF